MQGGTLLTVVYIQGIEHCGLVMIPSKRTLVHTQGGITHPMNCTRCKDTTIRDMWIKTIGLTLSRHYYYIVQASRYIQIS